MNFKKIVDHCVKHRFLSPNFSQFSFLGDALQRRIEKEWYTSNVIQNTNCLFISSNSITRINVELVQLLINARNLMGSDSSISLANLTSAKKPSISTKDVITVSDLIEVLPQTQLNLCTLTQPAKKIDEFIHLQKIRRRWWKSYLQQPVLLDATSVPVDDKNDPFLEQKIELSSSALGPQPFEVLKLYKPEVFDHWQVILILLHFRTFCAYFYTLSSTVKRRH